jgi:hypothetical protein
MRSGAINKITDQKKAQIINFLRFEENGRNANPIIPYSFIKVASIMNNNAHLSFPLLEKENPSKIHPQIRALDCNQELLFISS